VLKPQRRIFLKVIATGPFVGCAGADPGSASEGGFAGTESNAAGAAVGVVGAGGKSSASGGSAVSAGGSSVSAAGTTGNPFFGAGSSSGGNPFASAGGASGPAGASSGGTGVSTGGTGVVTGNPNPGEVVANVSAIALGSFQIVGGLYFMGRDANGIFAMSLQCTHKFCALVIAGSELDCPCHHSRFDRSGNVLVGPATEPLPYFKVYVDAAGKISVDKYTVVSRATRVAV
jgi:Rieske Fe-S protein